MQKTEEALAQGITLDDIMLAREKTWKSVYEIAAQIKPGMTEKEAIAMANRHFASQGVKKFWHKTHIRFGANTVLSFDDTYDYEMLPLKENDIFYLDVGPIWDGIEGDAGEAFVHGKDPVMEACVRDSKIVFEKVRTRWLETESDGQELCDFARETAKEMGWVFSPDYVKGHRLSEFPHSFHFKENLSKVDFKPSPKCWVLEVQICHPEKAVGAFYEDLLF